MTVSQTTQNKPDQIKETKEVGERLLGLARFLSYGRILTLHYYFLVMCILLAPQPNSHRSPSFLEVLRCKLQDVQKTKISVDRI